MPAGWRTDGGRCACGFFLPALPRASINGVACVPGTPRRLSDDEQFVDPSHYDALSVLRDAPTEIPTAQSAEGRDGRVRHAVIPDSRGWGLERRDALAEHISSGTIFSMKTQTSAAYRDAGFGSASAHTVTVPEDRDGQRLDNFLSGPSSRACPRA